jgi:hypothetical protein
MTLIDSALWLFLGLLAIGVILIVLRKLKPTNKRAQSPLFSAKQIQDWERAFAWMPTKIYEGNTIWLRFYWQRKVYSPAEEDGSFDDTSFYYQKVTKIGWYLW